MIDGLADRRPHRPTTPPTASEEGIRRVDADNGDHGGDIAYVETLRKRNDLPAGDVRTGDVTFYLGYDGDERTGHI